VPSVRSLRQSIPFDPRFVDRHALLWPLARAAHAFRDHGNWPEVASWNAVLSTTAPVRFAVAAPRSRGRARRNRKASLPYDTSIVERGIVPSREQHWHDFLNALTWATFPRAKAALHRRQGEMVLARVDHANRSREQDGLAMIDEGGVVALITPTAELRLVFGHAIAEGFVVGARNQTARMVLFSVPALQRDVLAQADAALDARLADPTFSTLPELLPRTFVPDVAIAPWILSAA
jgi:hypothetical protein